MRILGVNGSAIGPAAAARHGANERREPETESRALVTIEAPVPNDRAASRRPGAPFLAHLIATQMQAPQTRARRRAEPAEAIAAYAAMMPEYRNAPGGTVGLRI
jgi:hypothetical protein